MCSPIKSTLLARRPYWVWLLLTIGSIGSAAASEHATNVAADGSELRNAYLRLSVDMAGNGLAVNDFRTGRIWSASFDACAGSAVIRGWQRVDNPQYRKFTLRETVATADGGIRMTVVDDAIGLEYFLDATLAGPVLTFEVHTADMGQPITALGLPPMFQTDLEKGHLVFSDRSSGTLKDQSDPEGYAGWILKTYGNTACLDMPWVGVVDLAKGDGLMVLFETPLSSNMHLRNTPRGIWPQPLWQASMGIMHYPRRVSYRFSDSGGYVALAGMYRDYQRERGMLKTLAEKAAERPAVARLAGSPPIWGNEVHTFLKQVRQHGVTRALLGNAQHGVKNREEIEKINAMGYLTLRYDSYGDILEGKPGFQRDNIQKTALVLEPGGELTKGWRTLEGLQFYFRSSAFAMNAARAYSGSRVFDMGMNGHFIDVMCASDITEDYHPEHTFGRSQDMRHKRDVFKFYTDGGLVLGTEHGNDWAIDLIDFSEGALSGPLWWASGNNPDGWNPGHLQAPQSRDDFSPLYKKFGLDMRKRIPLWQLVYNDCVVSTWYWGDSPGWFYAVAPDISRKKDLTALLYGALTLFWRDDFRDYKWPNNKERFMESYHLTTHFQRAVFGEPMTSHAFVSDDRLVQRTRFGNGGDAWVNFGAEAVTVDTVEGRVTLAPYGFHATAPGLRQGRVLQGDSVVTYVEAKDVFFMQSASVRQDAEPEITSRLVLFRLEDKRWNLLLLTSNARSERLNVASLAKHIGTERFSVHELSADWELGSKVEGTRLRSLTSGNYAITSLRDGIANEPSANPKSQ